MPPGIRQNVSLAHYTTLHIGGVADYLCEAQTVQELKAAMKFAKQTSLPLLVLGGGSNVLVNDEGFRGLVIINKIKKREYRSDGDSIELKLGAGESFDEVVAWTVANGWWGLENLSAIPGTIGATPVQNVGAYGVEVSSLIINVFAIHRYTLEEKMFSNVACEFSYRDSFFKTPEGKKWIITEVTLKLSIEPQPQLGYADIATLATRSEVLTPQIVRNEIISVRSKKFPDWSVVGTAGSFFKNPFITRAAYELLKEKYEALPGFLQDSGDIKVSLGYILDKVCGLRGYCEGPVCLFEKQALVLIAREGATASDVKKFVNKVTSIVFEKTNIKIECEVQFV
jgi:UDP-N-acetylmuramate dehydrogenase